MAMVCKKAMSLSSKDRQKYTTGEITNYMAVDSQRILTSFPIIGQIWAAPLSIALAMYFLDNELGYSMFAGIGVLIMLLPITIFGTKKGNILHHSSNHINLLIFYTFILHVLLHI